MKHFSHHDIPQLSDPEGSGNIDRAALLIQRKTKICNLSSSKNSDGVIKDQSRPCLSRLTWKIILTGINYLHECIVNPGSWERSLRMSCRVIINLYRIYRSVHPIYIGYIGQSILKDVNIAPGWGGTMGQQTPIDLVVRSQLVARSISQHWLSLTLVLSLNQAKIKVLPVLWEFGS